MANPSLKPGALAKPKRGQAVLDKEALRAAREKYEREVIASAKARDGFRCRWPVEHKCVGPLEGAHITAKGQGGDPKGIRTVRPNIISVCRWIHRQGPETLEHHELKVDGLTPQLADGPLSFWRQGEDGRYYEVARERSIGMVERGER